MDEYLIKTLVKLAKSNINVLGITDNELIFEYQWRPKDSPKKWTKAVAPLDNTKTTVGNLAHLANLVTEIRKEVE